MAKQIRDDGHRWVKLAKLKYPLRGRNGDVTLPAGTRNVWVSFRTGDFTYTDAEGRKVRANRYYKDGMIYYGH